MKRKILPWLTAACMLAGLLLPACVGSTQTSDGGKVDTGNPVTPPDDDKDAITFKTSVVYEDGTPFVPAEDEEISIIWRNEYDMIQVPLGEDGTAVTTEADGEYTAHLSALPEGYTYNANIYHVDNDDPVTVIKLLKINGTAGKGVNGQEASWIGKTPYASPNPVAFYRMRTEGVYRAVLTEERVSGPLNTDYRDDSGMVYFNYAPTKPGTYAIESFVDVYNDVINPWVDISTGSAFYWNCSESQDTGGEYREGGYTKNFKWMVYMDDEMFSESGGQVSFTFGISADSKYDVFPANVDFSISYMGEYDYTGLEKVPVYAKEVEAPDEDYWVFNLDTMKTFDDYAFKDGSKSKDKRKVYADMGTGVLEGKNFAYYIKDENGADTNQPYDGFWHVYDPVKYADTQGFGPMLGAEIGIANRFMDAPLSHIQDAGNSALAFLSEDGTYCDDFTHFVSFLRDEDGAYMGQVADDEFIINRYAQIAAGIGSPVPCFRKLKDVVSLGNGYATVTYELLDADGTPIAGADEVYTEPGNAVSSNIGPRIPMGYLAISDGGIAPVTMEMKEFLQRMSLSQRYFMDGKGWMEQSLVASEEDQWLFLCVFFE